MPLHLILLGPPASGKGTQGKRLAQAEGLAYLSTGALLREVLQKGGPVADEVAPIPVLAAGGIGNGRQMAAALAMGAQGVWTGSLWLAVEESANSPAQIERYIDATSKDTVRSRSYTGKPCRMLRNDWTEAWERDDTPDPLGMPLQMMAVSQAMTRGGRYAEKAQDIAFNPIGQVVGTMNKVKRSADVVLEMVEECIESLDRMNALFSGK